ncbi:MAG: molybdopterin-dependent oxidoreductase Mo/Fe-S-binding subunit [Spirochaetales bacterium]|nr:molybdopterin-dependent oxidoreductase Mo/Fe-S-binding subunit [Spirochaetales bacterium]
MKITFCLNGKDITIETGSDESGVSLLKRAGIPSVRNSDNGFGFAGSDTILLDGKIVGAGLLVGPMLDGRDVKTIESLSKGRELSAIQTAMMDAGCIQSGYNSPAAALMIFELLERIPEPTRDDIVDALSGLFNRATGYMQFFDAVDIVVKRRTDPSYKPAIPEFRKNLKVIGKAAPKADVRRMAAGEKVYVEDRVEQGACVLRVLRSPHAHALIKSIDTQAAEKLPGVVKVFTHKNVPDTYYSQAGQGFPEPSPYDRKLIGNKVRHVGDRVAAVVAETEAIAIQALKLIEVEYEVLPPVLTIDAAAAADAPLIQGGIQVYEAGAPDDLEAMNKSADPLEGKVIYQFPVGGNPRKNIAASVSGGIGDMEKGFAQADEIIEKEYETSQIQCTPLETHTVYTRLEGDRIIVHASTQVPYHLRRIVATLLDIPENRVRVIKERVGGGYGSKQDILLEELCAYATWITGRPIFQQYSREEEFIACSTRKPMKIKIKAGATKDGKLTALSMSVRASQGPYGAHALTVPMNGVSKSLPLFECENFHFDVTTYYTNIPPTGAYQGYGAPKGSFAVQTAMRELSAKLGIDHFDFIEKNRIGEGSVLEILKCLGEGREGAVATVGSCGLEGALTRGRKLIDWDRREESSDPDVKIGKGVCIIQQGSGLPGLDQGNATLNMLGDGTFVLQSGGADLGTGLDTVCTKIVAETLKLDPEFIHVTSGDTDIAPFDKGAYASSGTYFSGGAALRASEKMREKILKEASAILGEPVEDLELVYPATVKGKKESLTYAKLAWYTQGGEGTGQIVASASFTTGESSIPYGAHFCQVSVNVKTGRINIDKYFALQDCGTPINPEYALGQIYGGVMKSIGHTLYEEMLFDDEGHCLTTDLRSYGVPTIGDLPGEFKCELIDVDDPFGPYGAKSVSEISVNGAAPVIANAVYDAVGIWMRSWPFSPEKVLKELKSI